MKTPNAITLLCALLFAMLNLALPVRALAQESAPGTTGRISPQLQQVLDTRTDDTPIAVIIKLVEQPELRAIRESRRRMRVQMVIEALQSTATNSQQRLRTLLRIKEKQGTVTHIEPFWIFNGLAVTATPATIQELATLPEIASIALDRTIQAPPLFPGGGTPEPNLALVNAPAMWSLGYQGQDVVIASMDTGVDVTHPDLGSQWRGGANSWFDPYGEHPSAPVDFAGSSSGHGTATMGVMVGGAKGGTAIGMAPAAQWIAVKIFNDRGVGTMSKIHASFQWLLDPDGNPLTDDAPHVVNGSWTFQAPGCDLEFEADLQALRAAGILPVFAAGNSGPNPKTSLSPGNNPSAFPVGNVTNNDEIYADSSRGPTACGGLERTFPSLVAPGVKIHSSDLFGLYAELTGTSLAAPHVSGALALLLSAFRDLTVSQQVGALINGAVDLGPTGPDNDFGYGRLDVLQAYQWLKGSNQAPTVDAGPDQTVTLPAGAILNGAASDDGLPAHGNLVTTWSLVSGPGLVAFDDPAALQTTATFSTDGIYTVRLTADDGQLIANDDAVITVKPSPFADKVVYVSSSSGGNVGGVAFHDEDILAYNPANGSWSLVFDGSDVGLGSVDVDAFTILADGSLLLSIDDPLAIPGVGVVDDSDILHFRPKSLGANTAGTFIMYLRGAEMGLSTDSANVDGADVDAIDFAPDGRLLLSTLGSVRVSGISADDEDLLAFNKYTGAWSLYLDGSRMGLDNGSEDVWAVSLGGNGEYFLSTKGTFAVEGVSGSGADIFACTPSWSSENSLHCDFAPYWQGNQYGFGGETIDAMDVGGAPAFQAATVALDGFGRLHYAPNVEAEGEEFNDDPNNGDEEPFVTEENTTRIYLPVVVR